MDGLERGHGAVVLVCGEPGIGKTRFVQEVGERTASRGVRTVWTANWPGATEPPLWSWGEILRQLTGSPELLEQPLGERPDEAEAARFRQFSTVADALRHAADVGPTALIFDDLQRADIASLRLFAFVANALRDRPCLLIGTARPDELPIDEMATLTRLGTVITLGGLDRDAVHEVLALAVGADAATQVADLIATRSGGNPLFVREFAQLMISSGRTDVAAAAVPAGVAAVIQRRLARLSETAMVGLQAAAVLGKEFPAELAQGLAGQSLPGGSEALVGGLGEAEQAGVLVRTSPRDLAFAHDLIRDIVLETISVSRRAGLHNAAAQVYCARLAVDAAAEAKVAAHFEAAGEERVEDPGPHWEAAGRHALGMLAYEQAAGHFARALSWATDPRRRADLLLSEADALLRAGELGAARDRFAEAATASRGSGQADRLAEAVLGIGSGIAGWEVPIWDQSHIDLVEEALASLPDDALALRSMLLARLSIARALSDTVEGSRRLAEEALELAHQVDDPALVANALASLCDALGAPEHAAERRAHAESIVELAAAAGDATLAVLGRRFLIVALLELGDFTTLDREIARFERDAAQLRQPLVRWYVPLFRGMRALLHDDFPGADHYQAEVTDAAARTGSVNAAMLAATLRIGIDCALGRPTPVTIFDFIEDIDPAAWASFAAGMAFLAMRDEDRTAAESLLRLHAENGFAKLRRDAEYLVSLMYFGRVAVWLAHMPAVERVYDLLRPHAGRWIVDGIAAVCWSPVDLELGRLAVTLGRTREAETHLEAARAAIVRAQAPRLLRDVDDLVDSSRRITAERQLDPATVDAGASAAAANEWRREGDFWTLSYDGRTVRMKDSKGLQDLARLLAEPGREIHVLDLYGAPGTADMGRVRGDVGEVIDARARTAYRDRLRDLEAELTEAEAAQDRGRAERIRAERDFLAAELAAAMGLGGRARRAGDPHERARKAVGTRIRLAVDRLAEPHPSLARHLRNSVRTGIFCSYEPEHPTQWCGPLFGDATSDLAPPGQQRSPEEEP